MPFVQWHATKHLQMDYVLFLPGQLLQSIYTTYIITRWYGIDLSNTCMIDFLLKNSSMRNSYAFCTFPVVLLHDCRLYLHVDIPYTCIHIWFIQTFRKISTYVENILFINGSITDNVISLSSLHMPCYLK